MIDFGSALAKLKSGQRVTRKGWNGADQFLYYVEGSTFPVTRPPLSDFLATGTLVDYLPHIDMRTAQGTFVPWLASQTDILAEDWVVV